MRAMLSPALPPILPLLVCLAGCPRDPCEAIDTAPALRLGTGWERFRPIEEGESLALDYGLQGGAHVYASLRAEGLHLAIGKREWHEDAPEVSVLLVDPVGEQWGGFEAYKLVFFDARPQPERVGEQVPIWTDPWDFVARDTWMRASVRDMCGNEAEAEARVWITPPE